MINLELQGREQFQVSNIQNHGLIEHLKHTECHQEIKTKIATLYKLHFKLLRGIQSENVCFTQEGLAKYLEHGMGLYTIAMEKVVLTDPALAKCLAFNPLSVTCIQICTFILLM